jgi:nitroimidazol reductase NimA-like FMN-containing flavoprotein (pyridoxamine 5'-phosphate oxidase superfamily)
VSAGSFPQTDASRLRRLAERGSHDRSLIHEILDAGIVAHVGLATERGPVVIPMAYARDGERLLLHGAPASRLIRHAASGERLCVTVTLLDGLVLARSAFHSSMNYRSVVAFGQARAIEAGPEKQRALTLLTEHLLPGRSAEARPMTAQEIAGTQILGFAIEEATAKVRSGPPEDPEEDLAFPVWAGVLPLRIVPGPPEPAPDLSAGIEPSAVVTGYARFRSGPRQG